MKLHLIGKLGLSYLFHMSKEAPQPGTDPAVSRIQNLLTTALDSFVALYLILGVSVCPCAYIFRQNQPRSAEYGI